MFLVCYGTRPELIKLFPIIKKLNEKNLPYKTLFSGQHKNLIKEYKELVDEPTITLEGVFEKGQSINSLISKIINKSSKVLESENYKVIVQGDAGTTMAIALSSFNTLNEIIHVEAGLRTNNLLSPFPEEANRKIITQIANYHFCPTQEAENNLKKEGVVENVFTVGNTIVDSFNAILAKPLKNKKLQALIDNSREYYLCTLHRRENRGDNFIEMWKQLSEVSLKKNIIYIKHPSVNGPENYLKNNVNVIDPVNYEEMLHLINNSSGLITDSGGIQEEAVCAQKNVLICRDTTERPETIDSGFGKLVGTNILKNIKFLESNNNLSSKNPYGENVSEKIVNILSEKINV